MVSVGADMMRVAGVGQEAIGVRAFRVKPHGQVE
jgi:hypothetical protein